MRPNRRSIGCALVAALLSIAVGPALASADDGAYGEWNQGAPPPPGEPPAGGYGAPAQYAPSSDVDVSVEMGTPGAQIGFATFHDGLAPYGEWVTVGAYGRVWRPLRVAAGWRPYYYGRWEWTDEGWLWVSDEPWGWAAYHYGRWAYDSYYGWVWIPGYQWAPAWVTWRYSPDYVGWAPLGPGFSVYVTSYPAVYGWWTFVPCRRFVGVPVHSVAFTGRHVHDIWGATRPAPPRAAMYGAHAPAWGGPARPFIEQHVGRPVAPVRVQAVASPRLIGTVQQSGLVQVYRPEAHAAPPHAAGVAPPAGAGQVARPAAPAAPAAPVAGVRGWGGPVHVPTGTPPPQQRPPAASSAFTGAAPAPSARPPFVPSPGSANTPHAVRAVPPPGVAAPASPSRPGPSTGPSGGGTFAPAPAAPRSLPGQPANAPVPHVQPPAARPAPAAAPPPPARAHPQGYAPGASARPQAYASAPTAGQRSFSPQVAAPQRAATPMAQPNAPAPRALGPVAHAAPPGHRR